MTEFIHEERPCAVCRVKTYHAPQLCDRHLDEWLLSPEATRVAHRAEAGTKLFSTVLGTALADFVHRVQAERLNGKR